MIDYNNISNEWLTKKKIIKWISSYNKLAPCLYIKIF